MKNEIKYNPIKEFENTNDSEETLIDKAFYLTDFLILRAEKDKNAILEEIKTLNKISKIKLQEYTQDSDQSLFLRNEIAIYYFYLVNLELSTILEKKEREKFGNAMISSFYSILKFDDFENKKIKDGYTKIFNERFRYYDQFANNPNRTYEEKVENHNNIIQSLLLKSFIIY